MISYNNEDLIRGEEQIPFFLKSRVFSEFSRPDYNWESDEKLILLMKHYVYKENGTVNRVVDDFSNLKVEIEGCPLECPFDPNEDFDKAIGAVHCTTTFRGLEYIEEPTRNKLLSMKTARKLIQDLFEDDSADLAELLTLERAPEKEKLAYPMYIPIIDSLNDQTYILIGYDHETLLTLAVMGPEASPKSVGMDALLRYHIPTAEPLLTRPFSDINREVHAIYEKIHGVYPANGKVFIEFLWSDPERVFEPPACNAQVKLAIKPFQGDANPFLKKLWDEIGKLDFLMELYETNLLNDMNKSSHTMSMVETNSTKVEEMKALLNQQSTPQWEKMLDFSDSLESNLERVSNGDRSDVDFTDRVWRILAGNDPPEQDVMECFHLIFSEIESKLYRPYLFPTNKTYFSDVLKRLLSHKMLNFRSILNPTVAIKLALDCGINKLFKDYSFVLRMCHLAETSDLDSFSPRKENLRESLEAVKKLHCMLEILCLTKERLGVSMNLQESQTRKLFHYMSQKKLDWNRTYHFDITMNAIGAVLEGMIPIYWDLKFETRNELMSKQTNCIISRDFYLDHAKELFATDEGVLLPGYYFYFHQKIKIKNA